MGRPPHAVKEEDREDDPCGVGEKDAGQLRGCMFAQYFFKQNNKDISQHNGRPHDAAEPDPVLAFGEGVNGNGVKGAEEDSIDPDSGAPPCGPGDEDGIESMTVPVNEVDDGGGRPAGIAEMISVGDDQLFDVDHVGNKEKVDAKEDNECNINGSLRKGQCLHAINLRVVRWMTRK